MRCLGIDYGEKRIGLAYGDELGVATPLTAAVDATFEDRMLRILSECERRRITQLVVGYPYNMDGTVGFKAKEVDAFIELLGTRISLPIERIDERLTSKIAESGMSLKEERKKRALGIVDSRAAAIILQDFLDTRLPPAVFEDFSLEEEE